MPAVIEMVRVSMMCPNALVSESCTGIAAGVVKNTLACEETGLRTVSTGSGLVGEAATLTIRE
jgi:hypothetical protein